MTCKISDPSRGTFCVIVLKWFTTYFAGRAVHETPPQHFAWQSASPAHDTLAGSVMRAVAGSVHVTPAQVLRDNVCDCERHCHILFS
jgi:hypothetical protein